MNRLVPILGIVLAVQLGLAALLSFSGNRDLGAVRTGEPLVQVDPARVDRIAIEAPGQATLVLEKKDGTWWLPDLYGFPAATARVGQLLDKLADLKPRLPVATSASAAERFKVAAKDFERKLVLASGKDTQATLYLGDSPGFRRIYARADDKSAVHEIEFALHEAGTKPDDWADKDYLHVKDDDVARAECAGLALERKDDKWVLDGLSDGEETSQEEAATVLYRLTELGFLSVLGTEAKPEYKQDTPALTCALTLKSGDKLTYVFSKPEQGNDYILKRSDRDYYFKAADYTVDALKNLKREKFVRAKSESEAKPEAETQTEGAAAPTSTTKDGSS